jgi:hypothetical protein
MIGEEVIKNDNEFFGRPMISSDLLLPEQTITSFHVSSSQNTTNTKSSSAVSPLKQPKMSSIGYCLTPKQATIVGIDDKQSCPPPPQASLKEVIDEIHVPTQELHDAPLGFFLAAPCNTSNTTDRRIHRKNNQIKLLLKRLRMQSRSNRIHLQPKRKINRKGSWGRNYYNKQPL